MNYTISEISKMALSRYKVIDEQNRKGNPLNWSDTIEIMIFESDNKVSRKEIKRRAAYKAGLCVKANE